MSYITCRLRARTHAGSRNLRQLLLAINGVPHFHKIDCDVAFPSPPSCHDILSGILQDRTKIVSPSNESIFDRTQNDRRATCSPESFPTLKSQSATPREKSRQNSKLGNGSGAVAGFAVSVNQVTPGERQSRLQAAGERRRRTGRRTSV